jgi:hypothetical protein
MIVGLSGFDATHWLLRLELVFFVSNGGIAGGPQDEEACAPFQITAAS